MKDDGRGLPFLTRDMLAFQEGKPFGLEVLAVASESSAITIRGFTKEGPFQYNQIGILAGEMQTFTFRLPDIPIMLTVEGDAGGQPNDYLSVTIYLTINNSKYAILVQGNVSGFQQLSWPSQLQLTEIQKRGFFNSSSVIIVDPATDFAINIPSYEWWKIKALSFKLVTDATVANRRVAIFLNGRNGGNIMILSNTTQTASQTKNYTFFEGATAINDTIGNRIQEALPRDIMLPAGGQIYSEITGITGTDQLSLVRATIEVFTTKTP